MGRGCSAVSVGVTFPVPKPEFWDKVPQGSRHCREQEPASKPSRCKEGARWNPVHEAEAPRAATQGTRSPCQRDRTLSLELSDQKYSEELRQEWAVLSEGAHCPDGCSLPRSLQSGGRGEALPGAMPTEKAREASPCTGGWS